MKTRLPKIEQKRGPLAEVLNRMAFSSDDAQLIATFVEIVERHRGSVTPGEALIWGLVMEYQAKQGGISLEAVDLYRQSFMDDIELATEATENMLRAYPERFGRERMA